MNDCPETSESLILRVKAPADTAAWSAFLAIYRSVVVTDDRWANLPEVH